MAQRNAARNARRTATTAAALMIGLTLVTTALVVGDSVKASMASTFERSAKADYYVTDELDDVEFPATLAGELATVGGGRRATGFTQVDARVDGEVTGVAGFDFDQVDNLLDVDVTQGSFDTERRVPGRRVGRRGQGDRRRAGRHRRRAVGGRRQRDGDDRRRVRRPGDPRRGLPVRHPCARSRRHRADRRMAGVLVRRRRLAGDQGRGVAGLANEYPYAASRPPTSSAIGWPAWSTRSWRWSTRWSRWPS